MKPETDIDAIKARIQEEIDKIYGKDAALFIIPAESSCGRCGNRARITREVPSAFPGVKPMQVCGQCANEAERFGLTVREIV